jgi:hypothetical protein
MANSPYGQSFTYQQILNNLINARIPLSLREAFEGLTGQRFPQHIERGIGPDEEWLTARRYTQVAEDMLKLTYTMDKLTPSEKQQLFEAATGIPYKDPAPRNTPSSRVQISRFSRRTEG